MLGVFSCNDSKVFEEEMYKKIFSLVSSGSYNIMKIEHDLEIPEVTTYVSASCGGTLPNEKETVITLREDLTLFNLYNTNSFESKDDYARLVPEDKYTIPNLTFSIPAGEKLGKMPIKIRPEGLSPDSTYFISLKVDDFTNYELNPEKSDILYQVLIKNYWTTQLTAVNYALRGVYQGNNIIGNKRVFPLAYNRVRVNVGNTTNFTADTADINTRSIILEVAKEQGEKIVFGKNYPVTVKPYGRITVMEPETVDPDYSNIFFIEDDGFRTYKTFLVHYRYKLEGDNTVYEMKEELRLEFVYIDI